MIEKKKKFQFDKVKQAKARQTPPLWTKDSSKYSRSQDIFECNTCGDTSFELLVNEKKSGRCCRCGENFK